MKNVAYYGWVQNIMNVGIVSFSLQKMVKVELLKLTSRIIISHQVLKIQIGKKYQ